MSTATRTASGELLNHAICQHVAMHGPCTSAELLDALGERASADTWRARRQRFAARLSALMRGGLLKTISPPGALCVYVAADSPLPSHADRQQAAPAGPAPEPAPYAWVPKVAPPPRYDVMRAPVYRPGPGAPMRPGANDFLHCPSREGDRLTHHHGGCVAALASGRRG